MAASRSRSPNQAQRLPCSKCKKTTDHETKRSQKFFGILRREHRCRECGTPIETVQMPAAEWAKTGIERDAMKKKTRQLEEIVQLLRDHNAAIERKLSKLN